MISFGLFVFYGITTLTGYLMLTPVFRGLAAVCPFFFYFIHLFISFFFFFIYLFIYIYNNIQFFCKNVYGIWRGETLTG